jgi:transcriptional regulator with XRE-family HTH domain
VILRALADGTAKARRRAAGITQVEMAGRIHVTQPAVSMYESGLRVPDAAVALAYGRALAAAEKRAA